MNHQASNYLEIKHLTFSYGEQELFRDFSARFPAGEWSALMAQSGAGKTTLLRLIAGLLVPQQGEIVYPSANPRFSFVFQENRLIESHSVSKNLRLVNPKLSHEALRACMVQSGLHESYLHTKVRRLSGGEQRRISILRALLAEYEILLLDEPFTGMDENTKRTMMAYMRAETAGKTVLLVTHEEQEAQTLACNLIIHL